MIGACQKIAGAPKLPYVLPLSWRLRMSGPKVRAMKSSAHLGQTTVSKRFVALVLPLGRFGLALVTGGFASGCSSIEEPPSDDAKYLFCEPAETCPPSVEGIDLTTPVSFRTDIYEGYFRGSCGGGSGCHGRVSNAAAGIYFGDGSEETKLTDEEIATLIAQLTQTMSEIAPAENLIVAGDWQNSWLMTKLDGCQDAYGVECPGTSDALILSACDSACGDGMPASEGDSANPTPFATTAEERAKVHKVRAWIAQGALDN